MIEFCMPSLGADMEDGTLVEWRVKPGDFVKQGDIIADVDTQKGLIEIEVFDEGTIDQLVVKEGAKVPVGTVMALINPKEEKLEVETKLTSKSKEIPLVKEPLKVIDREPVGEIFHNTIDRIKISPLAKVMAQTEGVNISALKGTGPEGSIVKKDIEKALKSELEVKVETPQIKEGENEGIAKNVRLAIAAAMTKSNNEIPHFYLETKIDLTKALAWLTETNKQRDLKNRLLPVVLFLKAMAKAIKDVPEVNAHWGNGLQVKEAVNIGFAISLRQGGVIIPAIHNVDYKTPGELMAILNELIPRAKSLKLRSSELNESTITLTNIGEGNVEKVYGVIYPPQVALVGFGSISEQPWAENGGLFVRSLVSVILAADHRAIDGHLGSKFLAALNNNLQNPTEL